MKAKQQPVFPPAIRAVFRAKCPQLQQIPRNFKGSPTGRLGVSQPEIQSLPGSPTALKWPCKGTALPNGNPDKKLLASTSGIITALKSIRETAASWYVVYHGEGDKEVRISKNDPRRRVFGTMEAAEAWAKGE